MNEYPKEYLVPFDNEPYLLGRITVYQSGINFDIEVSIVQKESRKVWKFLKHLQGLPDEGEAVEIGKLVLTGKE